MLKNHVKKHVWLKQKFEIFPLWTHTHARARRHTHATRWMNELLLLVVVFAVEFLVSGVAAHGERLLTHRALHTLLVPRAVVHAQEETVRDGSVTSFTHTRMRAIWTCNARAIYITHTHTHKCHIGYIRNSLSGVAYTKKKKNLFW